MRNREIQQWRARRRQLQVFLEAHHGVASIADLNELGFSESSITRLLDDKTLKRVSRGVYRSGATPLSDRATLRCRLISAGEDSALARRSAAHFLGYLTYKPRLTQVVVPRRVSRSRIPGGKRHGAPGLAPPDVFVEDLISCTTPFRTVLDLATEVGAVPGALRVLRRTLRGAASDDATLADRLRAEVEGERFPGSAVLRSQLHAGFERTLVIRSSVEDRFVELCERNGLPVPHTNAVVHGEELDAWFPEHGKFVEVDTFATHGDSVMFERDRARDADLAAVGVFGIHVTDRAIDYEEAAVVRRVEGLLGL